MKEPDKYEKWLKKIKKEIEYTILDEQSFELEIANYQLMYQVYSKMMSDVNNSLMYATMYNQLVSKHLKFLELYGLSQNAKLRNKYWKKKVDKLDSETPVETKDDLDKFLLG